MRLLIVAGEPSGDLHAAHLVRAIREQRPEVTFEGFGGESLRAAGCEIHADYTRIGSMVVGFAAHLRHYTRILRIFDGLLRDRRPAAAVFVDNPGFNFLLARLARWRRVPVVYYICPQIWAWAPWRLSKVLKWTDCLLPILPFEEELYANPRVPVTYVGHPLADELGEVPTSLREELREEAGVPPDARLIGVFPGSRTKEVESLGADFAAVLRKMDLDPERHRILVSCYRPEFRALIEDAMNGLSYAICERDSRALMLACDFALVASGTASLELAFFQRPMVVFYRTNRLGNFLFSRLKVTPWIALPNILGSCVNDGEATVVEKLFWDDPSDELAPIARALLDDGSERQAALERLRRLREGVLRPGGVALAATALAAFLDGRRGAAPAD